MKEEAAQIGISRNFASAYLAHVWPDAPAITGKQEEEQLLMCTKHGTMDKASLCRLHLTHHSQHALSSYCLLISIFYCTGIPGALIPEVDVYAALQALLDRLQENGYLCR